MKNLKESLKNKLLSEGLKIGAKTKVNTYSYHPKTRSELLELVRKLIKERGNKADLNDIDVSKVTNMEDMFWNTDFNGDISKWDVSNVKNMAYMFYHSKFNGDISDWDVSKVTNMRGMFESSEFSGDISKWNVNKATIMGYMFTCSPLANNPPKWYKKK